MNCGEAQDLIVSGRDVPATANDAAALAAHVASCESCRRTQGETDRLMAALGTLPGEAAVHAGIEARTMRRVHDVLDTERSRRPWRLLAQWLPAPALAAVAMAVIVSWWPATPESPSPLPGRPMASRAVPADGPDARLARAGGSTERATDGARRAEAVAEPAQAAPPAELAGAVDMFLELPILEHMEKLQNFETIYTTEVDGEKGHAG
jgi:hypothetical protein